MIQYRNKELLPSTASLDYFDYWIVHLITPFVSARVLKIIGAHLEFLTSIRAYSEDLDTLRSKRVNPIWTNL